MRSAILLTSALAAGAMAKPLKHKHMHRDIHTDVDLVVETVTVVVTAGYEAPAATPEAVSVVQHHHSHHGKPPVSSSSAAAPPPPPPSSAAYTPPPPAPTSVYVAPSSQAAAPSSKPAAPSSAAAVPSGGAGGYGGAKDQTSGQAYQSAIVALHNVARKNHGHDDLTWGESSAKNAQDWANQCFFNHSIPAGSGQGQNLFANGGSGWGIVGQAISQSWYAGEIKGMDGHWTDANIPASVFHNVGHLTQMVWKGTQEVGCASVDCTGRMTTWDEEKQAKVPMADTPLYTVCNYHPAGNVAGGYATNVGQPKLTVPDQVKTLFA